MAISHAIKISKSIILNKSKTYTLYSLYSQEKLNKNITFNLGTENMVKDQFFFKEVSECNIHYTKMNKQ